MARQKVAPENRIRAARACENCKRRKQKCNGTHPCDNCSKRAVDCMFIQPVPSTIQRRLSQKHRDGPEGQWRQRMSVPSMEGGDSNIRGSFSVSGSVSGSTQSQDGVGAGTVMHQSPASQSVLTGDPLPAANEMDPSQQPAGQSGSSETDEAEMQEASRMLNDGKGRMLYLGDSAPLSYLQTIRQLVGTVVGSSAFTIDPQRHKILEASMSTPPPHQHTCTLPDREAAFFLVDSFFANTKGIMHIFDEYAFKQKVDRTYHNPLVAEPSWLCILNLVFANGLQLRSANPQRSASETAILQRLTSDKVDRSEMFFMAAKHLKDSVSGFEDGDFASIQALLLMTLYMLTAAKRNTAWAYFGMAVRLAYALGLHRVETQLIFNESERVSRMMLWKSLYVMDRFISSCLGRPTAIHDDDCSDALFSSNIAISPAHGDQSFLSDTLSASVRSAKILGVILNRVYRKRKISLKIARGIAVDIHNWTQSLPEFLQWNPVPTPHDDPAIALAQLHIWLMYFQNIVLLTRPFLLLHVKKILDEQISGSQTSQPNANSPAESRVAENPELKKYSAACVRSAIHMIRAIQAIRVKGCLPRRNPFIIHWLFTAGLIVLTNSFFNVYENHENESIAQGVLALHQYCAETDLQSRRYLTILTSFQKTIVYTKTSNMPTKELTQQDPIENLFNVTQPSVVAGLSPNNNAMTSNYLSTQNAAPAVWDWRPKDTQTDMMQDITATGMTGQHSGESVEGLIYPGSDDLIGPDLSTIHEEIIHFDALWPLNQDSADLLPSQIHLYGTTPFT